MTKTFKWTVEFEVAARWVEDGFELTDERAKEMLASDLQFADGSEISAKVISHPDRMAVLKAQGYDEDEILYALKTLADSDKSLPREISNQIHKLWSERGAA